MLTTHEAESLRRQLREVRQALAEEMGLRLRAEAQRDLLRSKADASSALALRLAGALEDAREAAGVLSEERHAAGAGMLRALGGEVNDAGR